MSEVEMLSDETEDDIDSEVLTQENRKQLEKMLKLCQNKKEFPMKYIEDIDKMYKKCSDKEKNSKNLCNLILKGIKNIPLENKDSFHYVADIYNELLQLSKKDSTNLQVDNCTASTSRKAVELENENDNEVNKINTIFHKLIEKCYENPNFPDSYIKVVDKLYKSLHPEFVQSKYFVAMLEEANNKIWPDSGVSLFVHLEWIHEQLNQFKTSMEAQNSNIPSEDSIKNLKKFKKLKSLKVALKNVRKKIKDLEEAEMDINNENEFDVDSPYVLTDRYEKRALEIYKRMCKLRKEPDFLEAPPLRFRQTNDKLVNKTIEKYYNLHKTFPDYFEIYTLFNTLNKKKKLNWTETQVNQISHDAFIKLGTQLKVQRLSEYFSRLTDLIGDKDPADESPELKMKLNKSNQKLKADLHAVEKQFVEKQNNIEETDGSNLDNTDCEISSDDDGDNMNKIPNKKTNLLPVKRKRTRSNESDNDNTPKKNQKTRYMEEFELTPCSVALHKLDYVNMRTAVDTNKVPNSSLEENINAINISKQVSNQMSRKGKTSIHNSFTNLENNTLIEKGSIIDSDKDEILTIDEGDVHINGTITKIPQENEVHIVDSPINDSNTFNIGEKDNESIITEPEVIIDEGQIPVKDVIEINEIDDSDVEITESNTTKVPVQNNKSLETMIKAMNFDQNYVWDQKSVKMPYPSSTQTSGALYQQLNFPNLNNMVNRWVMNNTTLPPRPNIVYSRHPNHHNINRLPISSQRMPSSFHKNATQTAKQVTQRFQQQKNFTNTQSVVSQRVTTMTTTTTVRQIVQQQSSGPRHQRMDSVRHQGHSSVAAKKNNSGKPDLIELD